MKRIFTTILIMLLAFCPQAQRFEWAKGYRVDSEKNIAGVVTDSLGNLYLLGACDASSAWDGEDFISPDMIPRGKNKAFSSTDAIIAKLSPEGDMIWKKVIFSNNNKSNGPCGIRKLGDTAFACLVYFSPPGPQITDYTYFLDTFMNGFSDYPIDVRHFTGGQWTAYLVFDFDGNLTEQHYLAITYTDSAGNDLVFDYDRDSVPCLRKTYFENASFDVDSTGNIYISRRAFDRYFKATGPFIEYTTDDTIRGLKFWVDQRVAGEYRIEGRPSIWWFPQIVKFSPHFDTVLACRYVVQQAADSLSYANAPSGIKIDSNGDVYFANNMQRDMAQNISDTIIHYPVIIDSLQDISFTVSTTSMMSFLVKYDSLLNPKWAIYLDDSLVVDNIRYLPREFHSIDFDYDSNLLFIYAHTSHGVAGNPDTNAFLSYNGNAIRLTTAGFLAFQNGDRQPVLKTCTNIPARHHSAHAGGTIYADGALRCKGNRVFLQGTYSGGIDLPSQTLRYNWNQSGIGFLVFDYAGNLIDGQDYGIIATLPASPGSALPIVLNDSVVYFCNLLKGSARFGDIDFPVYGPTNCIAKYVDTAFMHPYVRPVHGITVADGHSSIAVHPNPARERLFFDLPAGSVRSACAISATGIRTQLPLRANGADISALAPGLYIIEIDTPSEKYHSKVVVIE